MCGLHFSPNFPQFPQQRLLPRQAGGTLVVLFFPVFLLFFLVVLLDFRESQAQEPNTTAQDPRTVRLAKVQTAWGNFAPGSGAYRRTVTRTYEQNSTLTNVTDTKYTLESVEDNRFALRLENAVNIGGQNFTPDPQLIYYDFYQQRLGDAFTVTVLKPEVLSIQRKQVTCQVCKYTQKTEDWVQETTLWYSSLVMPYILKKELVRKSVADGTILSRSTTTVTETSALRVFGRLLANYQILNIKISGTNRIETKGNYSDNVPGGLLSEVSVETNASNRVVSRTETTLLNYCIFTRDAPLKVPFFAPSGDLSSSN